MNEQLDEPQDDNGTAAETSNADESSGFRLMSDGEITDLMAVMADAGDKRDEQARAEGRRFLDEEADRDVIDGWYAEAEACETVEAASELMRRFVTDYRHDYGTVVHATSAGALAAAHAVSEGELTGFQAGAVFWTFARRWMHWDNGPRRLTEYANLLYPQYDRSFTSVSPETAEWLTSKAESLVAENGEHAHPDVVARWREIAAGQLPSFISIEAA